MENPELTPSPADVPPTSESISPPPTPRKDSTKLILGIGLGLILVAVIGLAALLLPRLLNRPGSANPTAAAMPADTQFFVSFNPHFEALPNGDVVKKAWSDPALTQSIEDGIRSSLSDSNLDWDQDIAPWLGDELGLGVWKIPFNATSTGISNQTPPAMVFALATRDTAKSDAFLSKWRTNRESSGAKYDDDTYRGIKTVAQSDSNSAEASAYASLNNLIVFATDLDDLHTAIDAALDNKGLAQSTRYQGTLTQLHGDRALTAFFDFGPELQQAVKQLPMISGLGEAELSLLEAMQGIGLGVSFEPNGLRLEMVAAADADKLPIGQLGALNTPGNPNELLHSVPGTTFFYLSGQNLADGLQSLLTGLGTADPTIKSSIEDFERQGGFELQRDLFGWMTDEFAIVGIPGPIGGSNQIPFGFGLLVKVTDQQLVERRSTNLFAALAEQSGNKVQDLMVGNSQLHTIVDASGQPTLIYGLIGDKFVLASSQDLAKKIEDPGSAILADDETFKSATALLPSGNSGYFYFEPKQVVDLLSVGLAFSGQECTACDFFKPIKAIASTSEQPPTAANISRAIMFVLLDTGQ